MSPPGTNKMSIPCYTSQAYMVNITITPTLYINFNQVFWFILICHIYYRFFIVMTQACGHVCFNLSEQKSLQRQESMFSWPEDKEKPHHYEPYNAYIPESEKNPDQKKDVLCTIVWVD